MARLAALCLAACASGLSAAATPSNPDGAPAGAQPGLTAATEVAAAYDAVLNAEFDRMPAVLDATCPPAPEVACLGLQALSTWWEIQLDPQNRVLDSRFSSAVEQGIADAVAWTTREPERAEAWFYLGAALGVRGQWKVLRGERLSAARDGKRIKEALERALAIDPAMHDAAFGIGAYRYYAGVAPSILRWLRWLLLLPGGNRAEGLELMQRASRQARIVRAEADYQLHLAYLWYERRPQDALAIVRDLQVRYPKNPLFRQIDAEIQDRYLKDRAASLAAWKRLLEAATRGDVHRASLADVRARLNIAVQLDRAGEHARARAALAALLASSPTVPIDAVARARQLQRAWSRR